jgi:hypothetical protein
MVEDDGLLLVDRSFVAGLVRKIGSEVTVPTDGANGEVDDDDSAEEEAEQEEEEDETATRRLKALKKLWDMSVNVRICALLDELGVMAALEALLLAPSRSSPRTQEVCLGLLANMLGDPLLAASAVRRAPLVRRLAEASSMPYALVRSRWCVQDHAAHPAENVRVCVCVCVCIAGGYDLPRPTSLAGSDARAGSASGTFEDARQP